MDWVHCNNCYVQPGDKEKKFVITNCGHIYCTDCTHLPELKMCRICHSTYQTIPLSSKMSKEVEIYFRDPFEEIPKLVKVWEFQKMHRTRFSEFNRDKNEHYETLKKEYRLLKEEVAQLQEEIARLREENKRISAEHQDCIQKLEYFRSHRTSQSLATSDNFLRSYNPTQKLTPQPSNSRITSTLAENHTVLRRPPENSNFFVMTSKSNTNENLFAPNFSKISGPFRSSRISTENTPPLPNSATPDAYQRKIKLPGDKGGPSPNSRASFHRLTLSKLTSTPKREYLISNKYSQYFNKMT